MSTVRLTIELPAERLAALQAFLLEGAQEMIRKHEEKKAEPVKAEAPDAEPVKEEQPEPVREEKPEEPEVTKSMLRALGIKLTKAHKEDALVEAFEKFGAKQLKGVKEEDYAALYKVLSDLI